MLVAEDSSLLGIVNALDVLFFFIFCGFYIPLFSGFRVGSFLPMEKLFIFFRNCAVLFLVFGFSSFLDI